MFRIQLLWKGCHPDLNFLSVEVQVLFEVVGQRGHHDVFVGLGHSPAVDPSHVHKVDQRAQYRLYRPASDLADPLGIGRILGQFPVHPVVVRFVDAFLQFLEFGCFAAALHPERTGSAYRLRTPIVLLLIAFAVRLDALEGQNGAFAS